MKLKSTLLHILSLLLLPQFGFATEICPPPVVCTLAAAQLIIQTKESTEGTDSQLAVLHQAEAKLVFLQDALDEVKCPKTKKPPENVLQAQIKALENIQWAEQDKVSRRLESRRQLALSGLLGTLADHYRKLTGKSEPGKKSFKALKIASQLDPDFSDAQYGYGVTMLSFLNLGGFKQHFIESGLGIDIEAEAKASILALTALDQELKTLFVADRLLQVFLKKDRRLSELREVQSALTPKLAALKAQNPCEFEDLEKTLAKYRDKN